LAGSVALGVAKSTSSALAAMSCMTSLADSTSPPGPPLPAGRPGWGAMPASRATDSTSPTMPAPRPVASDEHDDDGTDTQVIAPQLVQPLSASQPSEVPEAMCSRWVTELTGMVRSRAAGRLACLDSSSAIDATITTPRS
jgi:hypothetical protein